MLATLFSVACSPAPRNVLLIAVDTLRADHLGAYGYARETSPAIDALLASSVVFEDVQAASAWTLPSFASLMTSQHPATHRCRTFSSRLPESHTTLAEILRANGFETAAVVSHHFLDSRYGLAQGFDAYDESLVLSLEESHRAISSPAIHARADAWLRERALEDDDQPWFLFVHYFDPHHDYRTHPGTSERFGGDDIDRYDGEIAFTDAFVGKLLATLTELDLDDQTIVVFVSDHGEEFGDHGLQGHGRNLHREVTRLALGIRVPDTPPLRVPDPVHAVDLLPTLLELVGVPPPATPISGRSLAPLMSASATEALEPRGLVAEVSLYPGQVHSTYRLGRFKLFEQHRDGGPPAHRLFDVEADPHERRNLAHRYPERVAEYAAALRDALLEARALGDRFGSEESVPLREDDLLHLRALGYLETAELETAEPPRPASDEGDLSQE
jgi:arylsulfatase A-like enzyme